MKSRLYAWHDEAESVPSQHILNILNSVVRVYHKVDLVLHNSFFISFSAYTGHTQKTVRNIFYLKLKIYRSFIYKNLWNNMRLKFEIWNKNPHFTNLRIDERIFFSTAKRIRRWKIMATIEKVYPMKFWSNKFYLRLRITDGLHCCNIVKTKVARKFLRCVMFLSSHRKWNDRYIRTCMIARILLIWSVWEENINKKRVEDKTFLLDIVSMQFFYRNGL